MDRANAKRNQTLGLQVLQHTLQQAGWLPTHAFANAEEFAAVLHDEAELLFDGLEQRTQRPHEHAAQADCYSGKKVPRPEGPHSVQLGALDSLPQSVLGGEDARLPGFQRGIPADRGLGQETRSAY